VRGKKVVRWTKRFLDEIAPLASGSHAQVRGYAVQDGRLAVSFESVEATWLGSVVQLIGLAPRSAAAFPWAALKVSRC
jgi:malate synthase